MSVLSEEGEGTTFTVRLPLVEEQPTCEEVTDTGFSFRLRILVIDDRLQIVNLLKNGLEMRGQRVVTALSGPEGIERFKDEPADLIICDLGMPGMNGWEVGKTVKEFCKKSGILKPRFILLTGWDDQGHDKEKISESGVDAVIQKPVDMTKLLEIIRDVL
jgi:two-component system, sensor histidine kinase